MKMIAGFGVLLAVAAAGCGGSGGGSVSPSAPTATVAPPPAGGERHVTIAFWNDSTCSGEPVPAGTRKTTGVTGCTQDVPPTLYARVVDFSGCQ